jgi:hypothetical protein
MSDPITPEAPKTETAVTPPVETPPVTPEPVKDWEKEAEKWQHFSRKNEDEKKALQKQIDELKKAQMTDAEKAIEEAKSAGRKEGVSKVTTRLVKAELKAAAATAGVEIPKELEKLMKLEALADDDGEPDEEAIKALVASFKPTQFAQNVGLGPQAGPAETQVDYSPAAIAKRVAKNSPFG